VLGVVLYRLVDRIGKGLTDADGEPPSDFLPTCRRGARKALFGLGLAAICSPSPSGAVADPDLACGRSPVAITSIAAPNSRSAFCEVLRDDRARGGLHHIALIATLATVFSLLVTVSSGYMCRASPGRRRGSGSAPSTCFAAFPISPGIAAVFRHAQLGHPTTPPGILLPLSPLHICFFSWLIRAFFDGIDPSMEYGQR